MSAFIESGTTFGRLTVIKMVEPKKGKAQALCQCECGNTSVVGSYLLRTGATKSCGCLNRELIGNLKKLPEGESSFNRLYSKYKQGARSKNREFTLTTEQFREITSQHCHYCGLPPIKPFDRKDGGMNGVYYYNGIDRVDNSKGYTIDNVVACCTECNFMKLDKDYQEFIDYLDRVARFRYDK